MKRAILLGVVLLITTGLIACDRDTATTPTSPFVDQTISSSMAANTTTPVVIPAGATPYGRTYSEWSMEWWRWLWSSTPAENPGLDETGENIGYGQSGPVWFLAPNYGGTNERSATIPTGKALFIDVAANFLAPQAGDPSDIDELITSVHEATQNIANPRLEIDGLAVPAMEEFVVFAGPFDYTLPEDNMFDLFGIPTPAGTYYPAVSEGYFVMIPPLSAGEHTLHIYAEFLAPYFDTSEVTIHLTVSGKVRSQKCAKIRSH